MVPISRLLVCLLLVGLISTSLPVGSALNSANPKEFTANQKSLKYVDLDDDGSPEVLRIDGDFTEDGTTDRVLIYDRGDDMVRADDWRDAVDYRNDLFVYDAGANGQPELAIDFQTREGTFVATLYDNRTSNLSYRLRSDRFRIQKPESPALTVRSTKPWIADGQVSYDLRLNVSDPLRTSFTQSQFEDTADRIQTDINVSDVDDDGIPDYSIRQIHTDLPQSSGYVRTELTVNRGEEAILSPNDGVLWPYVSSDGGYLKPYGDAHSPIIVDWGSGQVRMVGEFVASRGDEDNYFIYSIDRLSPQNLSPLSFEYPFGFYDLASDNDNRPELQVRMEYYAKGSRRGLGSYFQKSPTTFGELRYSWDQDNDGDWEYKFGGVGTARYVDRTRLGPYRFPSPGYEAFPTWVSNRAWRSAVFVVAPDGFTSTEGIYEGGYGVEGRRTALGLRSNEGRLFNNASPGFRLEAADEYGDRPRLYYSLIDDQLHLYHLSYGYWTHSDGHIEYENLDADPYVDRWTRSSNGRNRTLYASGHGLMYATPNRVVVSASTTNESAFVTSVPTTTTGWEELRRKVGTQPESDLPDFRSIVADSDGSATAFPELTATGGTTTTDSIRVYARVNEQLSYNGRTFDPGMPVVVVLDSTGLEIHERTAPALQLSNVRVTPSVADPGAPITVETTIVNDGWENAENVTCGIKINGLMVKKRTVHVGGKQTQTVQMRWWRRGRIESAAVVIVHGNTSKQVEIAIEPSPDDPTFIDRFGNGMMSVPAAIGTLLAAFLTVIITWRVLFHES